MIKEVIATRTKFLRILSVAIVAQEFTLRKPSQSISK